MKKFDYVFNTMKGWVNDINEKIDQIDRELIFSDDEDLYD